MILKTGLVVITVFLISCGYKSIDYGSIKKEYYCIKRIHFPKAEATALDTITREVSDALISAGGKLECSGRTTRFVIVNIKSLRISPIGYSPAQRASIYKVSIDLDFILENRKNETVLKKNIREIAQYTGVGLTGDVERRYAVEEIGRLVNIRIFSILTGK